VIDTEANISNDISVCTDLNPHTDDESSMKVKNIDDRLKFH